LTAGHWGWWLVVLFTSASNFNAELDKCRHLGWVAWRICLWRWQGSLESFLFWNPVLPVLEKELRGGSVDLTAGVVAAWDELWKKIIVGTVPVAHDCLSLINLDCMPRMISGPFSTRMPDY